MNHKSQFIAALMIGAVILVTGFLLSYFIWGSPGDKTPDYAALLKESAHYLKTVERKNARLFDETTHLKEQIQQIREESLPEEVAVDDQVEALEKRAASLQEENTRLKTAEAENQRLLEENQQLEERLQQTADDSAQLQEQAAAARELQTAHQALEDENEQLKGKLAEYVSEKGVLEKQMAEMHTRLDADDALARENAVLKLTIENQESKIEALSGRLAEIEKMATFQSKGAPHSSPEKHGGFSKQ